MSHTHWTLVETCYNTVAGFQGPCSVPGVSPTGLKESRETPWHGFIQPLDVLGSHNRKSVLEGRPKGIAAREHMSNQLATDQRPDVFNGVHVWRVCWPVSVVEHPHSFSPQSVLGCPRRVHRIAILLKPGPGMPVAPSGVATTNHKGRFELHTAV